MNILHIGLKENTQILMSDGTTKAIQDIKPNEYIKSWDPHSKQHISSKVYMVVRNSMSYLWTRILFKNGTYLDVSNEHQLYCPKTGGLLPYSQWKEGEMVIFRNGNKRQIAWIQELEEVSYTNQYSLLTENSLYFANGILCGHEPYEKKRLFPLFPNYFLTEDDWYDAELSAQIYQENFDIRHNNPRYYRQSAQLFMRGALLKQKMDTLGDLGTMSKENIELYWIIKGEKKVVNEQLMIVKRLTNATIKKGKPRMFMEAQREEIKRIKERELRE